ncbi:MAG: hypothetical protein NT010_11750 [Proteobacteria bacterium]|nr:hypothetical protein [Pseudomonadota bacterium]
MKKIIFALLFVILAHPAMAQEVYVNAGVTQDVKTGTAAMQWSVTYRQALGEHTAFSFSYINEGHQPNHYRDGLAAQIWGRTTILDPRLSLALGVGPFAYADTKVTAVRDIYEDAHGFGIISSATATWLGLSPFLLQVRLNYIATQHSFDTLSATFGIGYLLDAKPSQPKPAQSAWKTDNEITLLLGQTVLNSTRGEKDTAMSVEYRRKLFRYMDWTVAWLNEGDTRPIGRWGVNTQLWAVRDFFNDHLVLGIGAGPYFARDKYSGDDGQRTTIAGDLSFMAAYRFHPCFAIRAAFSRIITDYSRDTDVFMGGFSYRF